MTVQSHDKTHRFIFDNTDIRGSIVTLEQSYQQVLEQQQLPTELLPLLGEFVAAVALLSESLKFEGILTLQVRGDGDIPLIMTEATDAGHVRGLLKINSGIERDQWQGGSRNLRELVGQGVLTLTIDPVKGNRYQGVVPLEGETLADCLAHYFEQSEQLPTRVWLFADQTHCAGLILQALPASQVTDTEQRQELWQTAVQLGSTLTMAELIELEHNKMLYRLFHEMDCRLFPARDIRFQCSCDRARSENAILSLGQKEALVLLEEQQGKIAIDCQFCGHQYTFDSSDLKKLFGTGTTPLH